MWHTGGYFVSLIFFLPFYLCIGEMFEDMMPSDLLAIENNANSQEKRENVSEGVKFYLYTRNNPTLYDQFQLDILFYLKWSHFDPKRPVKIIVHGWRCSYRSAYNVLVKNAYLTQYNVNVIIVDWSKYSLLSYPTSRALVPSIGEFLAELVDKLYSEFKIDPAKVHIVGHSLGAHVAGIAGLKTTVGKIGRITGLDPAGPMFSLKNNQRIGTESAQFVDIIHTSGMTTGFYHSLGHVDFYPNGGTPIQPGCGVDALSLRSHRRAYWLFAESITTPDGFLAIPCGSWKNYKSNRCQGDKNATSMGEHVSLDARGSYFLRTNYESPFALETLEKKVVKDLF